MSTNSVISDQDRVEATTVSGSHSGHKFEIQLGHLCNNRCLFCSSGQLTALKIARPIPLEPIVEALEEARANGATHLTFLGGEPTIHKRFVEAVEKAVELGFEHIVIFTNGVMFPHPGFIDSVTKLGNFEWRISIQGATDEAHVAVTKRDDSFERICHGLGELQSRGQLVTTNMCVNEQSYRSLPHYPELLERYGVRQLHVDIVRPDSTGERDEDYLRDIMPRYSAMAPFYAEMLEGFDATNPDFDVNVGNLPYCILPEWGHRIHHGGEQTVTKSSDGEGLEDAMNKYEWHESLRAHVDACDECVFRSRCTGIFTAYLNLYGEDEFRAVRRTDLLEIDPRRHNFVILVEPLLEPLRRAFASGEFPDGWSLRSEQSEDRHRSVEFWLAQKDGATARLAFVPPSTVATPVVRTEDWDLECSVSADASIGSLDSLLAWVTAKLREGNAKMPGSDDIPELHGTVARSILERALVARGQRRVHVLTGQVTSGFALAGWRIEPLKWRDSNTGILPTAGPDGARVDLVFSVGTRGLRSQVDVDFECGASTGKDVAKPVVQELIGLLQSRESAAA